MRHLLVPTVMLTCAALTASSLAQAETLETPDYIAVAFEAEDFDTKTSRWTVINASTGTQPNDPDGNHSDTASGEVYLEVLPDYRVTDEDEFHPTGSLWDAGQGPIMSYTVNFPEAGRYYVHLRAYSTGSEDNGAHVGIGGEWPPQARRMQWCAGKHQWTWSSAQRASGGVGDCGLEKTVYLDIPSAGDQPIQIAAREDGFELDRVVFIKDKSGNTRVCNPNGATQISCQAGSIDSADGDMDLQVTLTSSVSDAQIGDSVQLTARLENNDGFDHATNVVLEVALDSAMTFVSASSDCTHLSGVVTCTHDDLEPTGPEDWEDYIIDVTVNAGTDLSVQAAVSADEPDVDPANNQSTLLINGVIQLVDVDLAMSMNSSTASMDIGDSAVISIRVTNAAADDANGVLMTFNLAEGNTIAELPDQCQNASPVTCTLGVVGAGTMDTLEFEIEATDAGSHVHVASIASNNELDPANNNANVLIVVSDPGAMGGDGTSGDATTAGTDTAADSTDGGTGGITDGGNSLPDTDGNGVPDMQTTAGSAGDNDNDSSGSTDGITGGTAQANSGGSGSLGWLWLAVLMLALCAPGIRAMFVSRRASGK